MLTHYFIAEPIRTHTGQLLGVEVLTRFMHREKHLNMTEEIIYHLGSHERNRIFANQLDLISEKKEFFIKNNVACSVNIDIDAINLILSNKDIKDKICEMKFLKLELYEKIHFLHDGINNKILYNLASLGQELWMDDFGASEADIESLSQMPYSVSKIDRVYYLNNISSQGFGKTISDIKKICPKIIIEGVEDEAHLNELITFDVWGIQGFIFPSIDFRDIEKLHLTAI